MSDAMADIVRGACSALWGIPDCENCAEQEGCIIMRIWGLCEAGRPDVEGCSRYIPTEEQ